MYRKFSAIFSLGSILMVFAAGFFLAGCSPTRVTSVWLDREYTGEGIASVFVVGVSQNAGLRRILEDEFVALFAQRGVKAAASYRVLPDNALQDDEELDAVVNGSGSETILMTRLIDIRKETRYIPPDYVYMPPAHYYGGWHGYYSGAYIASPGYTVEFETAVLETNLYELKTDRLIWSARSDTPLDGKIEKHTREFARSIINRLAAAGLI